MKKIPIEELSIDDLIVMKDSCKERLSIIKKEISERVSVVYDEIPKERRGMEFYKENSKKLEDDPQITVYMSNGQPLEDTIKKIDEEIVKRAINTFNEESK